MVLLLLRLQSFTLFQRKTLTTIEYWAVPLYLGIVDNVSEDLCEDIPSKWWNVTKDHRHGLGRNIVARSQELLTKSIK